MDLIRNTCLRYLFEIDKKYEPHPENCWKILENHAEIYQNFQKFAWTVRGGPEDVDDSQKSRKSQKYCNILKISKNFLKFVT
jgi:hypothetical protein